MSEHWCKEQLNEAHKILDGFGAPKSEVRRDYRARSGENEFTLSVTERLNWVRRNWAPLTKSD